MKKTLDEKKERKEEHGEGDRQVLTTEKEDRFTRNLPLLRRAQAGDMQATEELVRLNGGLVSKIAARFLGRGIDYEDLVETGNIGLLKAIRTFDEDRACAFSTYAVPLIFGEIRRFLRDDGPIKVSRYHKQLGARLLSEREAVLAARGGENVRIEELAERCGVSASDAAVALGAMSPVSSLSDILYAEEDSPTLESTLCDEEESERVFNKIAVTAAIEKLPSDKRKIILLRYFRDYSQEETARELGLTQVKISREEKKILMFLRKELS